MLVIYPIVLKLDKYRRRAQHAVNTLWAKLGSFPFYRVKIEGRQHLPPNVQAAVYVANHQSFLDIFSLFHLNRSFKFISKSSIFYIPIVGWSMFLTGHVMLNRVDRRSQLRVLQECERLLSRGASLLFFPEGTRSVDQKLAPFKKGGFTVAVRTGAPVVPITVLGAGDMMPSGKEAFMYPGEVRMIVHPPMEAKGENAQELCDKARAVIASAMPQRLVS
ncbi:unnamed protein product [Ostreobium quekettii]|uniref:1-acyl-sn-glycerol-3-phosphate acyltransferase n=1 Tax=Ostreobium quekettii TaxID=121088 RepID=A0A8S1J5V5_9CHLO|nr:unnamed protein product [Ostreobium quekettii]